MIRPDSQVPGAMQIEMSDGSRHPVYQVSPGDPWWRSPDFLLYNPTTACSSCRTGWSTRSTICRCRRWRRTRAIRYVTEIRDPFDNTLRSVTSRRQGPRAGAADSAGPGCRPGAHGDLHVDPTNYLLETMTYNGRTWATSIEELLPGHAFRASRRAAHLGGVAALGVRLRPESTRRRADQHEDTDRRRVPVPAYGTVTRTADGDTYPSRVVWRRVVVADIPARYPCGHRDVPLQPRASLNETWVVGPSGRSLYRYDGIGSAGPFNVWRMGTSTRRSRYSLSDVELERATFTYVRSDPLATCRLVTTTTLGTMTSSTALGRGIDSGAIPGQASERS